MSSAGKNVWTGDPNGVVYTFMNFPLTRKAAAGIFTFVLGLIIFIWAYMGQWYYQQQIKYQQQSSISVDNTILKQPSQGQKTPLIH